MPWEDMHQQEESLLMEEKNNVFSHFLPMTSEGFPVEILRELYHAQKQGLLSFHGECFSYFSKKAVKIYLRIDLPTRYNASFGIVKSEEPVFIVFSEDFKMLPQPLLLDVRISSLMKLRIFIVRRTG